MSKNEVLVINTDNKNFFIEYLTLKKPVLEIILKNLTGKKINLHPKLLNVFAMLLYFNNIYKDMDDRSKWKKVFDYDNKVVIMNEIGLSEGQLNTYLSILRNIKLLTGKQISSPFIFYPDESFDLTFRFNINTVNNEQ